MFLVFISFTFFFEAVLRHLFFEKKGTGKRSHNNIIINNIYIIIETRHSLSLTKLQSKEKFLKIY